MKTWKPGDEVTATKDVPAIGFGGKVLKGTRGVVKGVSAWTAMVTVRFDPDRARGEPRVREVKADAISEPPRRGLFG